MVRIVSHSKISMEIFGDKTIRKDNNNIVNTSIINN